MLHGVQDPTFITFNAAIGAQDENRTHDLRITSALLYRLSYLGEGAQFYGATS